MHTELAGHVGLELGKAALRPRDDGRRCDRGRRVLDRVADRLALAGLVHEQRQIGVQRVVEHSDEVRLIAHLRDDAAAGLLGRLLGDALPALELLFHIDGLGHTARAGEKHDLGGARLRALLHEKVAALPLRQAGKHRRAHSGLCLARHDLDDLGLGLVLQRLYQAALIVAPRAVADDNVVARAQTQHADVVGVAAADDRPAIREIRTCYEKSSHNGRLRRKSLCRDYGTLRTFLQAGP